MRKKFVCHNEGEVSLYSVFSLFFLLNIVLVRGKEKRKINLHSIACLNLFFKLQLHINSLINNIDFFPIGLTLCFP
jgi:hypothetical protein